MPPDKETGISVTLVPIAEAKLVVPGTPDDTRLALPVIRVVFSVGVKVPLPFESVHTWVDVDDDCETMQPMVLFRRMASNLVSLMMFATCVAPSLSLLMRRVFKKLGNAITEMMRIMAITTMISTRPTPLMELRLGSLLFAKFVIVDQLFLARLLCHAG